jgi:hypothetical protein
VTAFKADENLPLEAAAMLRWVRITEKLEQLLIDASS